MSSQGSNSVRTISGATFVPMSGDPLSRKVSRPSASLTEFVPEVASRSVDRRAMEPVREAESSLDH